MLFRSRREAERWKRGIEETYVVRENAESIELRIPSARLGATVKLEINWEGGDKQHHWFWLPELHQIGSANIDGIDYLAKRMPLPKPLRLGYHNICVHWVKSPELETMASAHFIVCPERVKETDRRMAGIGVSLYEIGRAHV